MRRPLKLLLACPWMNREDLKCNVCPFRDPPQFEMTDYMKKKPWSDWTTQWQADECCCMGLKECYKAANPYSTFPA